MNGRDSHGVLASPLSVAKIPYDARRGRHFAHQHLVPAALGKTREDGRRTSSARSTRSSAGGFHVNVNVLDRADAARCDGPSGELPAAHHPRVRYAVNFVRLTREQQLDVINRTFHGSL